jgi:hypothetical protein
MVNLKETNKRGTRAKIPLQNIEARTGALIAEKVLIVAADLSQLKKVVFSPIQRNIADLITIEH